LKDQLLTGLFTFVLPSSFIWEVKTVKKEIYITFDDGPIPGLTSEILDILNKYNAKATFFCVGENVLRHREIYDAILEEGHATANHTHRHLKGWNTNSNDYLNDIREANKHIDSRLFRPPYGLLTYRQAKAVAKEFNVVMWSVLTRDYDAAVTKEECLQTAVQGVKPGSIIVFHDNIKAREKVLYALPRLLEYLQLEGYVSQRLEYSAINKLKPSDLPVLAGKSKHFFY